MKVTEFTGLAAVPPRMTAGKFNFKRRAPGNGLGWVKDSVTVTPEIQAWLDEMRETPEFKRRKESLKLGVDLFAEGTPAPPPRRRRRRSRLRPRSPSRGQLSLSAARSKAS